MTHLRRARTLGITLLIAALALTSCASDTDADPSPTGPGAPSASSPSVSPADATTESPGDADLPVDLLFQAAGSVWVLGTDGVRTDVGSGVDGDRQHPAWSPDGSLISFESNFQSVWVAAADGSADVRRLYACSDDCAAVFDSAWSPDGRELSFVRVLGDGVHTVTAQVVAVPAGGGEARVVAEDRAGDVWLYQPRWAPDGERMVVERDRFASNLLSEEQTLRTDLAVISNGAIGVVPRTRGARTPDWSPTADLIVYELNGNLFSIAPDGSERQRLTHFKVRRERAVQPTFTPDGDQVVFTWVTLKGGEATSAGLLDLDDGTLTRLEGTDGATHLRLRP